MTESSGRAKAGRDPSGGFTDLTARAPVYRFLAMLLERELTAGDLEALRADRAFVAIARLDERFPVRSIAGDASAVAEELAVEYARLFVGPRPLLPPYQSCHENHGTEEARQLWSKTTQRVHCTFRDLGLEFGKGYQGIPDHISILLEFLGKCLEQEAEAREAGNHDLGDALSRLRRRFFVDHLEGWAPSFFSALAREAHHPFYASLGRLAERFLESEVTSIP